jgi:hypothetical protein
LPVFTRPQKEAHVFVDQRPRQRSHEQPTEHDTPFKHTFHAGGKQKRRWNQNEKDFAGSARKYRMGQKIDEHDVGGERSPQREPPGS